MILLTLICIMQNSPMHLMLHLVEILMISILQILLDLISKDLNGKLLVRLPMIQLIFLRLSLDLVEPQAIRLLLKLPHLTNLQQELQLRLREFHHQIIISQQQFKVLVLLTQLYSHIYSQVSEQIYQHREVHLVQQ